MLDLLPFTQRFDIDRISIELLSDTGKSLEIMESSESNASSRFIAPQPTLEDRLKEQTIGFVQLSDFRKRRAEAVEQSGQGSGTASGASSPRDGYVR
jgi:protein FAM50